MPTLLEALQAQPFRRQAWREIPNQRCAKISAKNKNARWTDHVSGRLGYDTWLGCFTYLHSLSQTHRWRMAHNNMPAAAHKLSRNEEWSSYYPENWKLPH
jgi:hypothetical protein